MAVLLLLVHSLDTKSPQVVDKNSTISSFPSSYLHAEWASLTKLLEGDKRFDGKVKRYKAKQESLGIFANVGGNITSSPP